MYRDVKQVKERLVCWGSEGCWCWTTPSSWQRLRHGVVVWTHVFVQMVDILNINFVAMTFWCILFIVSTLISINLFNIHTKCWWCMKCVTFVSETFTRYCSNKTNLWQEILTPSTLAFSCKVVHKKLWKTVQICKSYSEKISGTLFYVDTV